MLKRIAFLILGLALCSLLYPLVSVAEEEYVFVTQWGNEGSENGQFRYPSGISVDNSGNVYVADTGNHRVQKFDSSGTYLTQWGTWGSGNGQFSSPMGIAVDGLGNVYVLDTGRYRVQKFDSNGTYLTQWGTPGLGNGQFNLPESIAVDNSGNVYVADTGNHRIQKSDSSGIYLIQWGTEGTGNGQFSHPEGIAVNSSGNVYAADTENHRVQKFDSVGTYLAQLGTWGSGNGQLEWPIGIAVDSSGNVYVIDSSLNCIQKFTSNGIYLTKWGIPGSGNGQFLFPRGIAVNKSMNVYVADTNNHRVQVFRPKQSSVTWNIPLKSGWNLISFPTNKCFYEGTEPPDQPDCVEKVDVINDLGFGSLAEWFSSVMIPNNAWRMVIGADGAMDITLPSQFHSLRYMSPGSGYWVKIDESIQNAALSMEVSPFVPGCPIPLKAGWNLVGCPMGKAYYDTNTAPTGMHVPEGTEWTQVNAPVAEQVFGSIMDDCELIIGEDGAYNPALPPAFSSLHFVGPGYGYWVKMKNDGSLIYGD